MKSPLRVMGKDLYLIEMLALPGFIYCLGVHQNLLHSYQKSRSTLLFSVKSYKVLTEHYVTVTLFHFSYPGDIKEGGKV